MINKLSIATTTGSYSAYLAIPRVQKGPGLLVLPEIYNSNHHIRSVADQFADAGFLSLAPDVFWRIRSECYLPYTADGLQNAREMNQELDVNQLINDLGVALETLGNREMFRPRWLCRVLFRREIIVPVCCTARSSGSCELLWSQHRKLLRRS